RAWGSAPRERTYFTQPGRGPTNRVMEPLKDMVHSEMGMPSVAGPPGIVRAWTGQSGSANVRADVGVTQRLPPCEPCVSALPPSADNEHEVGNSQQQYEESDCQPDAGPEIHCSAPFPASASDCNRQSVLVGPAPQV